MKHNEQEWHNRADHFTYEMDRYNSQPLELICTQVQCERHSLHGQWSFKSFIEYVQELQI